MNRPAPAFDKPRSLAWRRNHLLLDGLQIIDDGNGGGENKNENGENGDLAHPDEPQQRPWLRFAYSGASSLEGDSTLGFVVSSMIRKERSAAREATGVLCALLGVAEAEEAEEDEAEGEEGEEKEKEKEKSSVDDDEKNKQRSGPCLTPTLSPVSVKEKERDEGGRKEERERVSPFSSSFRLLLLLTLKKSRGKKSLSLSPGQARVPRPQPAGLQGQIE